MKLTAYILLRLGQWLHVRRSMVASVLPRCHVAEPDGLAFSELPIARQVDDREMSKCSAINLWRDQDAPAFVRVPRLNGASHLFLCGSHRRNQESLGSECDCVARAANSRNAVSSAGEVNARFGIMKHPGPFPTTSR
jgi:hypothetical protein